MIEKRLHGHACALENNRAAHHLLMLRENLGQSVSAGHSSTLRRFAPQVKKQIVFHRFDRRIGVRTSLAHLSYWKRREEK
jgi:hypothetical protein